VLVDVRAPARVRVFHDRLAGVIGVVGEFDPRRVVGGTHLPRTSQAREELPEERPRLCDVEVLLGGDVAGDPNMRVLVDSDRYQRRVLSVEELR